MLRTCLTFEDHMLLKRPLSMTVMKFLTCENYVFSMFVRLTCFFLGIIVKRVDRTKRDPTVQLIVSNHISLLDHMAIYLCTGCVTVSIHLIASKNFLLKYVFF